eukprot:TRINITY_DN901_c0_g1_i3.p1 TRINITY_DN901_c0_g1~~TRINITY_DN901_c0_g1_i3.p1  ORF type:complete len:512 (-),score=127.94 TRINITY_DN901_c0_g1_i3:217-1752(-)
MFKTWDELASLLVKMGSATLTDKEMEGVLWFFDGVLHLPSCFTLNDLQKVLYYFFVHYNDLEVIMNGVVNETQKRGSKEKFDSEVLRLRELVRQLHNSTDQPQTMSRRSGRNRSKSAVNGRVLKKSITTTPTKPTTVQPKIEKSDKHDKSDKQEKSDKHEKPRRNSNNNKNNIAESDSNVPISIDVNNIQVLSISNPTGNSTSTTRELQRNHVHKKKKIHSMEILKPSEPSSEPVKVEKHSKSKDTIAHTPEKKEARQEGRKRTKSMFKFSSKSSNFEENSIKQKENIAGSKDESNINNNNNNDNMKTPVKYLKKSRSYDQSESPSLKEMSEKPLSPLKESLLAGSAPKGSIKFKRTPSMVSTSSTDLNVVELSSFSEHSPAKIPNESKSSSNLPSISNDKFIFPIKQKFGGGMKIFSHIPSQSNLMMYKLSVGMLGDGRLKSPDGTELAYYTRKGVGFSPHYQLEIFCYNGVVADMHVKTIVGGAKGEIQINHKLVTHFDFNLEVSIFLM